MEGTYCWAASNSPAKVTAKLQERKRRGRERDREKGRVHFSWIIKCRKIGKSV